MGLVKWLTSVWLFGTILSTVIAGVRLSERALVSSAEVSGTIVWRWFVAPPLVLAAALALLGGIIATRQMRARTR